MFVLHLEQLESRCLLSGVPDGGTSSTGAAPPVPLVQDSALVSSDWQLTFHDEFEGSPDAQWEFQNARNGHILSSRWRENAVSENGELRLLAKAENRGGQDWTAASAWTRDSFQYGYFEARYRYGGAEGLNNSFWLMPPLPDQFEIDINEGHFPNEVNTNIHKWSGERWADSKAYTWTADTDYHTFGLLWTETDLVWFLDGQEIRREPNLVCHGEARIRLSLAVTPAAGEITSLIDGQAMDVDYVRVFQNVPPVSSSTDAEPPQDEAANPVPTPPTEAESSDPGSPEPTTDPVVSDPVASDPIASDPVVSDPVVSDPVVSDPVVSDPVVSDPVVSDPVVVDPVVVDPVSEPAQSDPVSEPANSADGSSTGVIPPVSDTSQDDSDPTVEEPVDQPIVLEPWDETTVVEVPPLDLPVEDELPLDDVAVPVVDDPPSDQELSPSSDDVISDSAVVSIATPPITPPDTQKVAEPTAKPATDPTPTSLSSNTTKVDAATKPLPTQHTTKHESSVASSSPENHSGQAAVAKSTHGLSLSGPTAAVRQLASPVLVAKVVQVATPPMLLDRHHAVQGPPLPKATALRVSTHFEPPTRVPLPHPARVVGAPELSSISLREIDRAIVEFSSPVVPPARESTTATGHGFPTPPGLSAEIVDALLAGCWWDDAFLYPFGRGAKRST